MDLCEALRETHRILILAPHFPGAARFERRDGLEIRRYRYFLAWGEQLPYEGGILPKLRLRPWLWLLVPFFMAALVLVTARVLVREPVDLIHAHWLVPQGLAVRVARLCVGRAVPLICTAHGADVFGLRGARARALQRWIAAGSVRVGAASRSVANELAHRGVPASKLRVLSMGVAMRPVALSPRSQELIAFAGRIVEKKGVGVLLDAFARLAPGRPAARLVIAGGGPDLAKYREEAAARGLSDRVDFLGPLLHADVQALFSRAAVAAMPSVTARDGDAEGLGLVMLEAMAAGCPIAVTDQPAMRDVVRPDENALVFPEGDGAALAAALERLLADRNLAARLAARAMQDVAAAYSWAAVAARHAQAYAEALAEGAP
ncbi:MAG TPA: glycosyltransferase [Verrucomicrobiae bacterium]|nr:glycosyltransferase [Verrucomicrobiae bacterium]